MVPSIILYGKVSLSFKQLYLILPANLLIVSTVPGNVSVPTVGVTVTKKRLSPVRN